MRTIFQVTVLYVCSVAKWLTAHSEIYSRSPYISGFRIETVETGCHGSGHWTKLASGDDKERVRVSAAPKYEWRTPRNRPEDLISDLPSALATVSVSCILDKAAEWILRTEFQPAYLLEI